MDSTAMDFIFTLHKPTGKSRKGFSQWKIIIIMKRIETGQTAQSMERAAVRIHPPAQAQTAASRKQVLPTATAILVALIGLVALLGVLRPVNIAVGICVLVRIASIGLRAARTADRRGKRRGSIDRKTVYAVHCIDYKHKPGTDSKFLR